MIKNKVHRMIHISFCSLCLLLTGCSTAVVTRGSALESAYENSVEEEPIDIYTSSASAVIESIDGKDKALSLHLIDRNESRILGYDGTTIIEDKYGGAMSMAQLQSGDIVEIAYNSELKRLGRITLSEEAWSYEGIERYNLHAGNGTITIGEESYSINRGVMAFSEGKPIEVAQIIHQDVLSFRGMGRNVMSITVDKGHGYLELENEDAVLGGWIEIGQTLISQIAPDMLFTVPEGSYTVRLTGTDVDEIREVTIERDRETKLDLSDIEIPVPDEGTVVFEITPKSADVYVDNEKVETTYPIKLSLGLHQVMAKASGYDSLAEYIKVEPETMTVKMELPEQAEDNSAESSASPGKDGETETSKKGNITIEAPKDVDVYQDNLYMGVAPVTYEKTAGEHTITLRRTGYITRSYEIVIADDGQDVTYSFSDLEPDDDRYSSPSPSISPSVSPSGSPTATPTQRPGTPTKTPTAAPTGTPTAAPTGTPTALPTGTPEASPSGSHDPSGSPSVSGVPVPSGSSPGAVPTGKPVATNDPSTGGENEGDGNNKPSGGENEGDGNNKPSGGENEGDGNNKPSGGENEGDGDNKPSGGENEGDGDNKPSGGENEGDGDNKPSGGENEGDGNNKPSGGENEGDGDNKPSGGGSEGDGAGNPSGDGNGEGGGGTPGGSGDGGTLEDAITSAAVRRMFRRPTLVQEAVILPLKTYLGIKL